MKPRATALERLLHLVGADAGGAPLGIETRDWRNHRAAVMRAVNDLLRERAEAAVMAYASKDAVRAAVRGRK